jgi:xyloglucan-specific exo-beta-1,4-glucanase
VRGFRHADIHQPPLHVVEPTHSTTYDWTTYVTDYDYCEGNPDVIMCNKSRETKEAGMILLSDDGGQTWKQTAFPLGKANAGGAKIAVSATWPGSTANLKAVFVPGAGQKPYYTSDGGTTWKPCKAADGSDLKSFATIPHAYSFSQFVAADRVDGNTFYIYDDQTGAFWVSRDGGATWKEKPFFKQSASEYDSYSPPSIQAAPGRAGEVWAAMSGFGISRTRDFGDTWESLPGTVRIGSNEINDPDNGRPCLVSFGSPAPGKPASEPTVFVFARLAGDETHSLLRSSDIEQAHLSDMKWERVQKWEFGGVMPTLMQGSRQKFGQVFMSGSEHGIIYGEPGN